MLEPIEGRMESLGKGDPGLPADDHLGKAHHFSAT